MEAAGVKNRIIVALDATTQVQAEKWGTRAVMVNPDTTGDSPYISDVVILDFT